MLPNSTNSSNITLETPEVIPDEMFLEANSFLDIVSALSPDAGSFIAKVLEDFRTATGAFTIDAGEITGSLVSGSAEVVVDAFNVPEFLTTNLVAPLSTAVGELVLANGVVNAELQFGEALYTVEDFDLATFAAEGLTFLLTTLDTTVPLADGAFLIEAETALGPINGALNVAGGDLDIELDTFAGTLEWSMDFGPEAVFPIALPTDFGPLEILVNFDSGNVEIPALSALGVAIPLSSLSGEAQFDEGVVTLSLDTQIGSVTTSFAIAETISDLVVDVLTGLSVEATLAGGKLEVSSTAGTETFETALDLLDLSTQGVDTLLATNGSIALEDGLLSGLISVGQDTFPIDTTAAELTDLLTAPITEFIALSSAA